MRGNSTTEARRRRIAIAEQIVKKLGRDEYIKAVSMISFNLGVTEAKAREYLKILSNTGVIEIKNGYVNYIGSSKAA